MTPEQIEAIEARLRETDPADPLDANEHNFLVRKLISQYREAVRGLQAAADWRLSHSMARFVANLALRRLDEPDADGRPPEPPATGG